MTPVRMEFAHPGATGDCLRACIASVLDMPRRDVPHFVRSHGGEWFGALYDWAQARAITALYIYEMIVEPFPVVWIGKTARSDDYHAVVAQSGRMIHDPFPEGGGLIEAERSLLFMPNKVDWRSLR